MPLAPPPSPFWVIAASSRKASAGNSCSCALLIQGEGGATCIREHQWEVQIKSSQPVSRMVTFIHLQILLYEPSSHPTLLSCPPLGRVTEADQ